MMTARQLLEALIKLNPSDLDKEIKVGIIGQEVFPNDVEAENDTINIILDDSKNKYYLEEHECPNWYSEADKHDMEVHKKYENKQKFKEAVQKCIDEFDKILERLEDY